jgi:ferredoxin-type protein NapG
MSQSRRTFIVSALGAGAGALLGAFFRNAGGVDQNPALLRPPGALPEPEFLGACIRCGQCVERCPYDTLLMAGSRAGTAMGTPYVDPERIPCYLCQGRDTLECIAACPTGALVAVDGLRRIRMGTAVILEDLCLAYNKVMCRACWHACPFPNEALKYDEMLRPVVDDSVCIGCGLCTLACPTQETSIPIRPRGRTRLAAGLQAMVGDRE